MCPEKTTDLFQANILSHAKIRPSMFQTQRMKGSTFFKCFKPLRHRSFNSKYVNNKKISLHYQYFKFDRIINVSSSFFYNRECSWVLPLTYTSLTYFMDFTSRIKTVGLPVRRFWPSITKLNIFYIRI